jgi:hypothetical protein
VILLTESRSVLIVTMLMTDEFIILVCTRWSSLSMIPLIWLSPVFVVAIPAIGCSGVFIYVDLLQKDVNKYVCANVNVLSP